MISGADEGIFGWIALNYLAGRLMTAHPALVPAERAPRGSLAALASSADAHIASAGGATNAEAIFGAARMPPNTSAVG